MFRKSILFVFVFFSSILHADIVEIERIDEIRPYVVGQHVLCLFDIDDTLIDNPFDLGSPPWRNWVRKTLPQHSDFVLFDALTLYIAKHAPYKTVEPNTAALISDLQESGVTAFGFTARGRSEWYTTTLEGVDRFTHDQLTHVGIDFKRTPVPEELKSLKADYFFNGIIFAKHIPKGDLLKILFKDLNYTPSLILFVDDKLEQVKSVEEALKEAGIPFIGFWYRRSEKDRAGFNAMATNIQLEFLFGKRILCNAEARELAKIHQGIDPQAYLLDLIHGADLQQLVPVID